MSFKKIIGILLILAGLVTIIGFIVNNHIYWFFVDIYNIIICGITGFFLLLKK
jgi:hypothetical protein